jgi:anthranilate phosphoribosyltransferase
MKEYLIKVFSGVSLTTSEAEAVMDCIMGGGAKPEELAGYLGAIAGRGESVGEIVGSVRSMRRHAKTFSVNRVDLIDVCGTGGDGSHSFNVSTTNALLLAAAGLGVVKHGNRAISSACGSADVLEALGIAVDAAIEHVATSVDTCGFGFLFAPKFHPAMQYVGPTRRALGVRTLFNLLGPLANPAPVRRQVVGVFARKWLLPMAEALRDLGTEEALVVWGEDGLDEISLSGATYAVHLKNHQLTPLLLTPEEFGVPRSPLAALRGGDATTNAKIIEGILSGEDRGPRRDIVMINAGAALKVAGLAPSWKEGANLARDLLQQGAGARLLNKVRAIHV